MMAKALFPYFLLFDLGSISSRMDEGRRSQVDIFFFMSSQRYSGAMLCNALKQSRRILYSIRTETGSQCNFFRTGVM